MANWTVEQVTHWLKENGFKKQIQLFREKHIDGQALMRLTDEDISELFDQVNEDGTIQKATIGVQSRFRTKLIEWKRKKKHKESKNFTSEVLQTKIHSSNAEDSSSVITNCAKTEKKQDKDIEREASFRIDRDLEIQFFQKTKFLPVFIQFIRQESIPIGIKIEEDASSNYIIKLIGIKNEIRTVRKFIKTFLESIQSKDYEQKDLPNWSPRGKPIEIIQKIFDQTTSLFILCELHWRTITIHYFNNEKFNSPYSLKDIENILQNEIRQANIVWSTVDHHRYIVHFSEKYQFARTEQFSREYDEILNRYKQDDLPVRITAYESNRKCSMDIFGYKNLVNEVLGKFNDLFAKYRIEKFEFRQLSSGELDFLDKCARTQLHAIEQELRSDCVKFDIQKNQFSAPEYLKDEIETRIKDLLSQNHTKTLKNFDLISTVSEKFCLKIKTLAENNRTYCEIKSKSKLRSYPIPKGHGNSSNTSKSIIEQSDLFCSSSYVNCQAKFANSSIQLLIDDIALQKADVLVIPSNSSGLKENLIARADHVTVKSSSNPFITEITPGNLKCQKILFVNWSVPTSIINDEEFSESIQMFIFRVFRYIIQDYQKSNLTIRSLAFAMPDFCKQEQILAEEMIEETINQLKSLAVKVSFMFMSDQQSLYKYFLNTIEKFQQEVNIFGIFYSPITSITITLLSFDSECLTKCERKIQNYLQRSLFKMELNGFQSWNQHTINAFYKYAIDRSVLPQQVTLVGLRSNVDEVYQKYQLIQQRIQLPLSNYKLMICYSAEDSLISQRLATRLIDEGFSVKTNQTNDDLNKMKRNISKSDCILLCLSENYCQNEFCQQQTKYTDELGKYFIPIKIQYFQPFGWLRKFVENHSAFHLFGSENNFNFEYEKIVLKILSMSSSEQMELDFLLTLEQKKIKYEKQVKKLIQFKKGTITEDENEKLLIQTKELLDYKETLFQKDLSEQEREFIRWDLGILSLKQWLTKFESFPTKLNIPPFTITGDINDAKFPLLDEVRKNSNLLWRITDHCKISDWQSEKSKDSIRPKRTTKMTGEQVETEKVKSKRSSIVSRPSSSSTKKSKTGGKKMKKQSIIEIERPRVGKEEKEEIRTKFAEQMRKNEEEFEKFCEEYDDSISVKPQSHSATIFGPNPFGKVETKTRPIRSSQQKAILPLKFPWNGVFNTHNPVVTIKRPEVLFFFEE